MGLTLSKPGEASGWIALDAALVFFAGDSDEAQAEAAKAAKRLDGVAVRALTLERGAYLELVGGGDGIAASEGFKAVIDSEAHHATVMAAGLHSVRGVDGVGEQPEDVTPELHAALAASGLSWLVARVVMRHNGLTPEQRQAFFTLAAAD